MRRIDISTPKYPNLCALVDDEDYEQLSRWKWRVATPRQFRYYAQRTVYIKKKTAAILMHRQIMNPLDDMEIDHINHNCLDNRKTNLRICTRQQNNYNRLPYENGSSKYKGVYWYEARKKWRAKIQNNLKTIHLGYFNDEIKAAKTYDKKAKELFGEFAYLNFDSTGSLF